MDIKELIEQLESKKAEVRSLNNEGKVSDAEKLLEEVRNLKSQIKIAEELEEDEKRQLENKLEERKGDESMETRKVSKELEYRALVKAMMGKSLSEEERAAITDGNFNSNSGAIIPSEFINRVVALRDGYVSLKNYCDVIPVTSDNGKMPTTDLEEELADLEEDTAMVESMMDVKEVDFKVADYGLLKKVGNDLLSDSPVNFIDNIVAPAFAIGGINKENKKIVAVVDGNSTKATVGTDVEVADVIAKNISKSLPSVRSGLVIITNTEGYSYLDNLKDSQGRKDDRVTYNGDKLFFKNKEVVEVADKLMPTLTNGKTQVFYLVNLKTVPFFDRQYMEIARSTEAGFTANKTLVRAIERFDVKSNPNTKIKAVKIEA